ncbi:MAG: hypothetical protein Q9227_006435 [Pyrenula ochraceoflavens]
MAPENQLTHFARREFEKIEHLRQSATLSFDIPSRIIGRAATSSAAAKKDNGSSGTLAIALGAGIPVVSAIIVLFFLHRRHVKRLRREDANDRDKELDFGMGEVKRPGKKGAAGKGQPEMSVSEFEKSLRKDRGLSLEMDMSNPYLLPPGLQTSRESIHSLSRSFNSTHDPYRPATTYIPNDSMSNLRNSRRSPDDSSSYSGSAPRMFPDNESSQNLLRNAQRMSRSLPPTQRNSIGSGISAPLVADDRTGQLPRRPPPPSSGLPAGPRRDILSPPSAESSAAESSKESQNNESNSNGPVLGNSADYLGPHISGVEDSKSRSPPPESQMPTLPSIEASPPPTGRKSPPRAPLGLPGNPRPANSQAAESSLAESQPLPRFSIQSAEHGADGPDEHSHGHEVPKKAPDNSDEDTFDHNFGYDPRRLTMGVRPLPPEDMLEDPETRANRIRSFYKEYFDDSKPGPTYNHEDYYDPNQYDYGHGYDGTFYDPASGQFITAQAPYAEPIGRRAMTPPPRGPPRFHGQSSVGSFSQYAPGPRAFSSVSGRYVPPRVAPKKAAPPPKPLHLLPTPHMLKDDSIIPIDFAPPSKMADRAAGRVPDSPRSGMVPFSPVRPVHNHLVSSFDDLAIMPSPHALRKSGTFTALDFAPPPRFKNSDTGSDAGSIRSNRSGRSAMQVANIRAGAYRLSRIPREVAGTKQEITAALRPTMNMT